MPTTKRPSAAGARARPGPGRGQSTISFAGRVTKSAPTRDAKKAVAASASRARAAEAEAEAAAVPVSDDDQSPAGADDGSDAGSDAAAAREEPQPPPPPPPRSEAQLRADDVSDAQIRSYWSAVERRREAPRVHQDGLDVSEKVLRYFDVSSQYGPCVGLARMKRWHRADRLGLNPPIEVLAVLLREEAKGCKDLETAHMDSILNSIAVGT